MKENFLEEIVKAYVVNRGFIARLEGLPVSEPAIQYYFIGNLEGHDARNLSFDMLGVGAADRQEYDAIVNDFEAKTEEYRNRFDALFAIDGQINLVASGNTGPENSIQAYEQIASLFKQISTLQNADFGITYCVDMSELYQKSCALLQKAELLSVIIPDTKVVVVNLKKAMPKFKKYGINVRNTDDARNQEPRFHTASFSPATLALDRLRYLPDRVYESTLENMSAELEKELAQMWQIRLDDMLKQKIRQHIKPDEDAVSNWYRDLRRIARSFGYDFVSDMLDTLEPRPRRDGYTAAIAVEEIVFSYRASTKRKSPDELLPLVTTFRQRHRRMDLLQLRKRIQLHLTNYGTSSAHG